MKKMKNIFKVVLAVLAVAAFFSCDIPVGLGAKLDIYGPVVTIDYPGQRKIVPETFYLMGTASDATGVSRMEVKATKDNKTFARQWRYVNNAWEISNNSGATWSPYSKALWTGDNKYGSWSVAVDMNLGGTTTVEEGEYTFSVQAWDTSDFTDAESYKAVVLIIDLTAPKADVSLPYLYRDKKEGFGDSAVITPAYTFAPLKPLHDILDAGSATPKEYEDPQYLGKFLTQEFELKWQVDDMNDVYSIDLRFYKHDVDIDDDELTPLPDNWIYRFTKNTGAPPEDAKPGDYISPNGSVIIPDLGGATGNFDQDGVLKTAITEKTTVKVVVACYDAAGKINQEKTLGYFIFWPRANNPWITFQEGMKALPQTNQTINDAFENSNFTTYPSKSIKATAYQAHGVQKVEYSVWEVDVSGVTESSKGTLNVSNLKSVDGGFSTTKTIDNKPYSPGKYTNIFAWDFAVPPRTGWYVVKAKAYSGKGWAGTNDYTMLFQIMDITFPDFGEIKPEASSPLYLSMGTTGTSFTISGQVTDVSGMSSLCLVWINPESRDAAANAQLVYFRESGYGGWLQAKSLAVGATALENPALYEVFDPGNPNRLWKLALTPASPAIDPNTNRKVYNFSRTINLSDLKIDVNTSVKPYLTSQMFLLRAENSLNKCTVITYAPQGDTSAPAIKINDVEIKSVNRTTTCYPNQYTVLPAFANNDTITINGKWREDSVKLASNLNLTTFFKNNFEISINNTEMRHLDTPTPHPALNVTRDPSTDSDGSWDGRWTLTTSVKTAPGTGEIALGEIKDTLVIDAKTKDIGGNVAEIGCSWLIESDKLQLMRISSEKSDDIYGEKEKIEIFLEFSKPVKLNPSFTGTKRDIALILSSASGNKALAKYKDGQNDPNSRQFFEYEVTEGDNTTNPKYLNVTGLYYDGSGYPGAFVGGTTGYTPYNQTNYPFAWQRGSGDTFEEVRLTMAAGKTGDSDTTGGVSTPYFVRTLPTNTTTGNADYQYTLFAAKHIEIDTTPPTIVSISTTTPAGYYNAGDIYFTIKFSEAVKLKNGGDTPQFPLNFNGSIYWTSPTSSDVRVNGDSITFKYTVTSPHTSAGRQIYVSANTANPMRGDIYDIAGNKLLASPNAAPSGNGLTLLGEPARTLTGVYVETLNPGIPTVRILTAANVNNVLSQTVGSDLVTGKSESETGAKNLTNVYDDNLWIAIEGNTAGDYTTTPYKCDSIQYSVDNGNNWLKADNITNTPVKLERTGDYKIIARQIDKAGNISANSNAVNFNWDPGPLLTRISSTSANGLYTNNTGGNGNVIEFTFYFRKRLFFTLTNTNPTMTLNATDNSNADVSRQNSTITATQTQNTNDSSITFRYTVANGHKTPVTSPNPTYLDIKTLGTVEAWDGSAVNNGVDVSRLIKLPSGTPKLDATKQFRIETGPLTLGTLSFRADSGTDGNDNYHGISGTDGSYWTTLEIPYNHVITRGSGNITITQIEGSGTTAYRLPAVLTETQYNRFKNIANINSYYVKGTNGYDNTNGASDTTTKYILQYNYNPDTGLTAAAWTGDTLIKSTAQGQTFATALRNAEAISINVNSQAVTLSTDQKTLYVRLTGSSAPQVPGATYEVSLPAGLVTDELSNVSSATTPSVTLRGVAKPFVRVRKSQDTITPTTSFSMTRPRLEATQPMQSYARMDCRTPGATITYSDTEYKNHNNTNVTTMNWGTGVNGGTTDTGANGNGNNINGPQDTANGATRPANVSDTSPYPKTYSSQITLGDNPAINSVDVQGYQWWVRAKARVGTSTVFSKETEEKAYRTVITLQVRGWNGSNTTISSNDNEAILESGDQIWIRGGDAIGSSSVPGFPFTWEDNWSGTADEWKNKRAGIRLMSKTNTTDSLNNSEWKFVTWEINTTAYIDFIMGRDASSSAAQAWQYGPEQSAYQRSGWTSFKDKYPVYPGKHRWCDMAKNWSGKYAMNFSKTFHNRPTIAPFNVANSTTYDRWPGINTQ